MALLSPAFAEYSFLPFSRIVTQVVPLNSGFGTFFANELCTEMKLLCMLRDIAAIL